MPQRKVVFWEVDAQSDFMLPGGKLYVPGAEKIIPNIRRLVNAAIDAGVLLVSSGDSHPENDPEFELFPPHCIRASAVPNDASRELPAHLLSFPQIVFEKQTLDVFDNPHAGKLVQQLDAGTEFVVFGVVTEYCVRCAARGLLERGRKVAIVKDAIETLDAEKGRCALDELQTLGARIITTDEALAKVGAYPSQNANRDPVAR